MLKSVYQLHINSTESNRCRFDSFYAAAEPTLVVESSAAIAGVYAGWLMEQGDPRGELIRAQLAGESGWSRKTASSSPVATASRSWAAAT